MRSQKSIMPKRITSGLAFLAPKDQYCRSMTSPAYQPLGPRTSAFAKAVRRFVKQIPFSRKTIDDCEQIVRPSGSVGANYIGANDVVSKRDFLYRIRICRKEAKESFFWLDMLQEQIPSSLIEICKQLMGECDEILRIFTKIAKTTEGQVKSQ